MPNVCGASTKDLFVCYVNPSPARDVAGITVLDKKTARLHTIFASLSEASVTRSCCATNDVVQVLLLAWTPSGSHPILYQYFRPKLRKAFAPNRIPDRIIQADLVHSKRDREIKLPLDLPLRPPNCKLLGRTILASPQGRYFILNYNYINKNKPHSIATVLGLFDRSTRQVQVIGNQYMARKVSQGSDSRFWIDATIPLIPSIPEKLQHVLVEFPALRTRIVGRAFKHVEDTLLDLGRRHYAICEQATSAKAPLVRVHDLASGNLVREFTGPPQPYWFQWIRNDAMLVISAKQGMFSWSQKGGLRCVFRDDGKYDLYAARPVGEDLKTWIAPSKDRHSVWIITVR